MVLAYIFGLQQYLKLENIQRLSSHLQNWANSHVLTAPLLFVLIYIATVALSLPGATILSLVGGFLFGALLGTFYIVIGASIGASCIFLAVKTAFGDRLKKRAKPFLKKLRAGFEKNQVNYMLFLRLIPLFPFWLVNIAPALLGVRFKTFAWTTALGIIPGAFVYAQAGVGLNQAIEMGHIFTPQMQIALVLIALLILVPVVVKRVRDRH